MDITLSLYQNHSIIYVYTTLLKLVLLLHVVLLQNNINPKQQYLISLGINRYEQKI